MFEPKIKVEIIGENGIKSRKAHAIEGNKVVIEKASKGRGKAGYKAKFDKNCLLHREYRPFPWLFKRHSVKLMLKEGASSCIDFFPKVKIPSYDAEAAEKMMEGKVLKAASRVGQKIELPIFFWLLMIMLLGLVFLQILISTGRIYI